MYHPTRGGVRGGRDQFSWDEVKVDKHRENYLGHSIKAPVGRWQKGKDLHWYTRDNKSKASNDALKEEIKRIKEEEDQAMREALGLAPKRSNRPQGNRLDKHEFSELVKRGSTAEDVGAGHSEAAWVHGLGFARAPRPWEDPSTIPSNQTEDLPEQVQGEEAVTDLPTKQPEKDESEDDEKSYKRRRREEKKPERERRSDKHERHEKRHSRVSDDRRRHKKDKHKRKHDSD